MIVESSCRRTDVESNSAYQRKKETFTQLSPLFFYLFEVLKTFEIFNNFSLSSSESSLKVVSTSASSDVRSFFDVVILLEIPAI